MTAIISLGTLGKVAVLSPTTALICYGQGSSSKCNKIWFDGSSNLNKTAPMVLKAAATTQIAMNPLSATKTMVCYVATAAVKCSVLAWDNSSPGAGLVKQDIGTFAHAGNSPYLATQTLHFGDGDQEAGMCYQKGGTNQVFCQRLPPSSGAQGWPFYEPRQVSATSGLGWQASARFSSSGGAVCFATTIVSAKCWGAYPHPLTHPHPHRCISSTFPIILCPHRQA
jgi:hypothetical protein